jgi:aspartate racemase
MKKLGLVGGMSWVSTLDYYRYINEGINQALGGLNGAECVIYSLNFADVQARQWPNTFELLRDACQALERSGVDGIVLCANTAHLMVARLKETTRLPIIDIVAATADAVRSRRVHKVGLLGTKFTMELDFYRAGLAQKGVETLIPESPHVRDFVQDTLRDELGQGIFKDDTKARYLKIIDELIAHGAQGIVLGCTEIPLLIGQDDVPAPTFDTTRIHAQAAVDFALSR